MQRSTKNIPLGNEQDYLFILSVFCPELFESKVSHIYFTDQSLIGNFRRYIYPLTKRKRQASKWLVFFNSKADFDHVTHELLVVCDELNARALLKKAVVIKTPYSFYEGLEAYVIWQIL